MLVPFYQALIKHKVIGGDLKRIWYKRDRNHLGKKLKGIGVNGFFHYRVPEENYTFLIQCYSIT